MDLMQLRKTIAIILGIGIILVGVNIGAYYYLDRIRYNFAEDDALTQDHELGAHGIEHIDTKDYDYNKALSWAKESIALIEDNTDATSRWGETCISLAYPYSSTNEEVMQAAYDSGFRIAGNCYFDSINKLIILGLISHPFFMTLPHGVIYNNKVL